MHVLSVFGDGSLFGERIGADKPSVLLLHGWRGDHSQMSEIANGFNAISLDLPGFGASPQPQNVWGSAEYAEVVKSTLKEFECSPVVVGYSFGGRVAVNLAANFPDQVKALVLVGVPLIRRAPSKKTPFVFRAVKLANRWGILSDERMEVERKKRGSADYKASSGLMRDVFVKLTNESYETQLSKFVAASK